MIKFGNADEMIKFLSFYDIYQFYSHNSINDKIDGIHRIHPRRADADCGHACRFQRRAMFPPQAGQGFLESCKGANWKVGTGKWKVMGGNWGWGMESTDWNVMNERSTVGIRR